LLRIIVTCENVPTHTVVVQVKSAAKGNRKVRINNMHRQVDVDV